MNEQLQQLQSSANDFWQAMVGYFSQPWFAYEVLIIVVLFIAARLLSSGVKPRLEHRARSIKAHPGLLRLIATLLRRTHWVLFVLALAITLVVMRSVTWPSRSYLISIALSLAFAWLTISVLSRVIRSRMVARVVAGSVWFYVAVSVLGVTEEVARFLSDLGFSIGETRISALLLIKGLVLLSISLWLAISLGNFLDNRIQRSDELTPSLRVLIGKVLKITFMVVAVVVAMSGLGIDLTAFTVFSGAVGVGVGFGLQKVVSNFISGIIILLDRSIKPGDTISLGDTFGWIRELRARFVSVVTRDGREYLIPNEDFITQQVINWSFSNELVRVDVEFGVSYDSDPHVVSALAIGAATKVERVVQDQKPVCWMTGFGDSSLDFVLRFWIQDPQNGLTNIRGKVLLALWDSFKENGIAIPYPHRELIVRRPVRIQGEPETPVADGNDDRR
jgi:small-conductance mechanosensitive channel